MKGIDVGLIVHARRKVVVKYGITNAHRLVEPVSRQAGTGTFDKIAGDEVASAGSYAEDLPTNTLGFQCPEKADADAICATLHSAASASIGSIPSVSDIVLPLCSTTSGSANYEESAGISPKSYDVSIVGTYDGTIRCSTLSFVSLFGAAYEGRCRSLSRNSRHIPRRSRHFINGLGYFRLGTASSLPVGLLVRLYLLPRILDQF